MKTKVQIKRHKSFRTGKFSDRVVLKMSRMKAQSLANILTISERLTEVEGSDAHGAHRWGLTTMADEEISWEIYDALYEAGFVGVDSDGD